MGTIRVCAVVKSSRNSTMCPIEATYSLRLSTSDGTAGTVVEV